MRRKLSLILTFGLLFAVYSFLSAQENFLYSRQVAPGVIHHHEYRTQGPWHIHVIEIDRLNPWIQVKTVKARGKLAEREKTSVMTARCDSAEHHVVSAINGDFYDAEGVPVGAQVCGGVLLKNPTSRAVFAISDSGIPMIDILSLSGHIWTRNGSYFKIDGINKTLTDSTVILYNSFFGKQTTRNQLSLEFICELLTDDNFVNDTSFVEVIRIARAEGNNYIPQRGLIISAGGQTGLARTNNISSGDTLAVLLNLKPANYRISELIGGTPRLIRNGMVSVEWEKEKTGRSFTYNRHPRTAVGISADSTRIFFITVDGRQAGYSVGMSLFELANYMLEWGIEQGINLDGGGSTTMVVRGEIVNCPSDAEGERAVSNALMVVSTTPADVINRLQIKPTNIKMLKNMSASFQSTGYDQYFNPWKLSTDKFKWSCDPKIGSINREGRFTAGQRTDSGFVYVLYKTIKDSARVFIIDPIEIRIENSPPTLATGEQFQLNPTAWDNLNHPIMGTPLLYNWSLSDPIGSISQKGVFTAGKTGDGFIYTQYGAVSGSTFVSVRKSKKTILEDFNSIEKLSLDGISIDTSRCKISLNNTLFMSAPSALGIDYDFKNGDVSIVNLNLELLIEGTPDRIGLSIYGDGKRHRLSGELTDADGEKFILDFTMVNQGIDWLDSWKYIELNLSTVRNHWSNPEASLTFPVSWTKIYVFETDKNRKDSGTILIDDLNAVYLTDLE